MTFLHPVFTIMTIVLIIYSFQEVYNNRSYKSVWVVVWIFVILIGLRAWVGADYPIYMGAYNKYGQEVTYSQMFEIAIDKEGAVQTEMEWFYVLIGKVVYDMGMPFFMFTLVIALIAIPTKYIVFSKNTIYTGFTMLLYMYPTLFTSDGGHMRQGVAMAILLLSFKFIKERKLLMFMFMMYLAIGFHNSALPFIIMYWLVLIPLNSTRILIMILISMALSPLKLYEYIGVLDAFASTGAFVGFQSYDSLEIDASTGFIKFMDLVYIMYTYFLVTYDKEACEKVPYYEYMRNVVVIGICMYFIFRWNSIFSTRLVMNFLIYAPMVLVNIIFAISNLKVKKSLHLVLVGFIVFYYFVYTNMQAEKARYTIDGYSNFLWYSE